MQYLNTATLNLATIPSVTVTSAPAIGVLSNS